MMGFGLSCEAAPLACPGDDVPGFETLFEESSHLLHIGVCVFEEVLVAFTQRVEPFLSPACGGKAVFGTFATAGKEVFALAAV